MTASVSTAGPYYASGEIKFSDLRRDFRAQIRKTTSSGSETTDEDLDEGSISAAELLRVTDVTVTDPIVPDSTENSDIATSNDLKLSQFRNSIKYYYITQSGTNENFSIDTQSWNTNLDKNINKVMFIDGICGSNSTSSVAAEFNASSHNLTIDVYGQILACGGDGGSINAGVGGDGGDAMNIVSSSGEITVLLRSTAQVYAGGGGGGGGKKGAQGSTGTCYNWQYKSADSGCEWCGSCGDGWEQYSGCNGIQGCACFIWCRKTLLAAAQCRKKNTSSKNGGEGGNGGTGGNGRGYNWQSPESLSGNTGVGGASGNCNGYDGTVTTPGTGKTGKTGANGGDWGINGYSNSNTGDGGSTGSAIYGTNYSVIGASSDTVKGSFTAS